MGFFDGGSSSSTSTVDNSRTDSSTTGDILSGLNFNFGNNNVLDWGTDVDNTQSETSSVTNELEQAGGTAGAGGGLTAQLDANASVGVSAGSGNADGGSATKEGGSTFEALPATSTSTYALPTIADNTNKYLMYGGIALIAFYLYKRG